MSAKEIFELCLIICLAVTENSKADGDVYRRLLVEDNSGCPRGHYCPKGDLVPLPCPAGTYNNLTRQTACRVCPAGYFCPQRTITYINYVCPVGFYCPTGSVSPIKCPAGMYNDLIGQSSCVNCLEGYFCPFNTTSDPHVCPAGASCPYGSAEPIPCPPGTYNMLTQQSKCGICQAGFYCPANSTSYKDHPCPVGFYCPEGSAAPIQCSAGTFSFLARQSACLTCPAGRYCPYGTAMNDTQACPPGMFCPSGSVVPTLCPAGTYNDKISQATCVACPAGYYCPAGSTSPISCPPGTFRDQTKGTSLSECIICPAGHYCTEAAIVIMPCPSGSYNDQSGSTNLGDCITCPCGKYCGSVGLVAPTGDCKQALNNGTADGGSEGSDRCDDYPRAKANTGCQTLRCPCLHFRRETGRVADRHRFGRLHVTS